MNGKIEVNDLKEFMNGKENITAEEMTEFIEKKQNYVQLTNDEINLIEKYRSNSNDKEAKRDLAEFAKNNRVIK